MGNLGALEKSGEALPMNIYTMDIDSDRDFVMELGVRSVPTLKVYKGGEEVYSNVGVMSCLLYTSPSPRDRQKSRMPSSA